MPNRNEYSKHVNIVVDELFPNLSNEAKFALAWLIVDFFLTLDAMISND
jgi:hypothetical protein